MINMFDTMQLSEAERQNIVDDCLLSLEKDALHYVKSQSKVFGLSCWVYYFYNHYSYLDFNNAVFSKDNKLPLIYVVSNDFNKLHEVSDKSNSYLKGISFGEVKPIPEWAKAISFNSNQATRKKAKHIALSAIIKYNKGEVTKEGKDLAKFLSESCDFLGFIPHISYIKDRSRAKDELKSIWVHPFGQRTMLYKIKNYPILVIANSSLELDDSALAKVKGNENNPRLKKGTIGGITG